MALIDVDVSVIFLGEFIDLIQRSDISVHAEDSISDDHFDPSLLVGLQVFFQVGHVHVVVTGSFGFAEADAVDDGGVIEGIADNYVFGTQDGLEETSVGIETAGEQDGVLKSIVVCDGFFEFFVDILGAADEAD